MDRLLCGDVGYGKTEVALRAVMKCVCDGKQAAILVPTTVLAQQHYQTAVKRFEGQPVEIRVLSPISFAEDTELYLLNMSPGAVLESEAHSPGCMEILAVASGSFRVTAGKRSTVLEKGDVLTYQCDVPHRIENVAEDTSQLYMTVKFA